MPSGGHVPNWRCPLGGGGGRPYHSGRYGRGIPGTEENSMTWHTRVLVAGVAALALGVGTLVAGRSSPPRRVATRGGDLEDRRRHREGRGRQEGCRRPGEEHRAGRGDAPLRALRSKKGLGMGEPKDKITPDGIEAYFINLGRKAPARRPWKNRPRRSRRRRTSPRPTPRYAILKAPEKKEGTKDPKDWVSWCKDQKAAARAGQGGQGQGRQGLRRTPRVSSTAAATTATASSAIELLREPGK